MKMIKLIGKILRSLVRRFNVEHAARLFERINLCAPKKISHAIFYEIRSCFLYGFGYTYVRRLLFIIVLSSINCFAHGYSPELANIWHWKILCDVAFCVDAVAVIVSAASVWQLAKIWLAILWAKCHPLQ